LARVNHGFSTGLARVGETLVFFLIETRGFPITGWHGYITGLAWVWHGLVDTKSLTRTFSDWGSRIQIGRRKADGKLSWFSVSVGPYEASAQSKIYLIGTFRDNAYLVAGWRKTQCLELKPRVLVQVVDKHEVSSRTLFLRVQKLRVFKIHIILYIIKFTLYIYYIIYIYIKLMYI
jgi:hypothetical protein